MGSLEKKMHIVNMNSLSIPFQAKSGESQLLPWELKPFVRLFFSMVSVIVLSMVMSIGALSVDLRRKGDLGFKDFETWNLVAVGKVV